MKKERHTSQWHSNNVPNNNNVSDFKETKTKDYTLLYIGIIDSEVLKPQCAICRDVLAIKQNHQNKLAFL